MRKRLLFALAFLGIVAGVVSAYLYRQKPAAPAPLAPSRNPYSDGIYAEGIIQSAQMNGENINIYPQVGGTVTKVFVHNGEPVVKGTPLFALDDSVQKRVVAEDQARIGAARASLAYQSHQLEFLQKEARLDPRSVSRITVVSAQDNLQIARENLQVAIRTLSADQARLALYQVDAPVSGTILRAGGTADGAYASPQGVYGTYSQGMNPVVVMGEKSPDLEVQAYLDEILVPRLPASSRIAATMFVRGAPRVSIPLKFVRIQPYVVPKIELSNQRTEKVDVRVLPILFRFTPPKKLHLYPGELVDVYIAALP